MRLDGFRLDWRTSSEFSMQRTRCINPQWKDLFFIATVMYLCFLICLCMEIMERGLWGYFISKSITGFFLCLNFGVCNCISKTQLCTKEHIGVYSVIKSVITLLINENLDFDIHNSVLVVRKNTCCYDRAAQCPTGSCWSRGALAELPEGSQWNMQDRDVCY